MIPPPRMVRSCTCLLIEHISSSNELAIIGHLANNGARLRSLEHKVARFLQYKLDLGQTFQHYSTMEPYPFVVARGQLIGGIHVRPRATDMFFRVGIAE